MARGVEDEHIGCWGDCWCGGDKNGGFMQVPEI